MLTKEGSRLLLTNQTLSLPEEDETWPERTRAWFCSPRRAWLSACPSPLPPPLPAACLRERLWDWFILVHHPPHQSFTWDCEDDKSESLMWSKVSGSDSMWVNTKDSLVPFFFKRPPPQPLQLPTSCPCHPFPLSPSRPPHPLSSFHITPPTPPLTPFPDILRQCVDRVGFVN